MTQKAVNKEKALNLRADLQVSKNSLPNKSSEIFHQTWGRKICGK